MNMEELFKKMFHSFFVITTGIVISMYIFCRIFYTDASYSLDDIGRILVMSIACDLTYFIYYSRKELEKKQMYIRTVIHFAFLLAVLIYLAGTWDWVSMNSWKEIAVFVILVAGVYAIVLSVSAYKDKKLTNKLNESLKERYHS